VVWWVGGLRTRGDGLVWWMLSWRCGAMDADLGLYIILLYVRAERALAIVSVGFAL